jgi:transcriptional regulator
MYLPAHFRIDDPDECLDIVERRAAGTLVVGHGSGFEASLLPWLVHRTADGDAVLQGHVARSNPLVGIVNGGVAALVTFDLVDGYVSPSWYPSKSEHHRVVPTWNHVSVHVHGQVRALDDPDWLRDLVGRLTDEHESDMSDPWSVDDAPDDFVAAMLRGIVGLEVRIDRMEGKAKLSQNKSAAERAGVVRGLSAVGDDELWAAMTTSIGEEDRHDG